jgi:hypothetical protein
VQGYPLPSREKGGEKVSEISKNTIDGAEKERLK